MLTGTDDSVSSLIVCGWGVGYVREHEAHNGTKISSCLRLSFQFHHYTMFCMDFPNHIMRRAIHHLCAIYLQCYLLNCFSNNYKNFLGEFSMLTEQKMELKFYPSCLPLPYTSWCCCRHMGCWEQWFCEHAEVVKLLCSDVC